MPNEIKIALMRDLLLRTGAERVSKEASLALAFLLEELGLKISKEAIDYASHAGRKTVKPRDIELATRKVLAKRKKDLSRKY